MLEIINFMAIYGCGLICLFIDEKWVDELDFKMMVFFNIVLYEMVFIVLIDLIGYGCIIGILVYDWVIGI